MSRSLATLKRTNDATVAASPAGVSLDLHLGLGQLEVEYDYTLEFKLFKVSGHLKATVRKFSLGAKANLFVDEDEDMCKAVLVSAAVEVGIPMSAVKFSE